MSFVYDSALVAQRVQMLDGLGVGPLWLPRAATTAQAQAAPEVLHGPDAAADTDADARLADAEAELKATAAQHALRRGGVQTAAPMRPAAPASARQSTPATPSPASGGVASVLNLQRNAQLPAAVGVTGAIDAAWHDDAGIDAAAPADTPLRLALIACVPIADGSDGAASAAAAVLGAAAIRHLSQYLFVMRPSSAEGTEELFDNILRAIGLRRQGDGAAVATGTTTFADAARLNAQLQAAGAGRDTMLVLMDAGLAAQLSMAANPAAATTDANTAASASMEQWRGRVLRIGSLPAIVTYGPAHLVRNRRDKRLVWDDLCMMLTHGIDAG